MPQTELQRSEFLPEILKKKKLEEIKELIQMFSENRHAKKAKKKIYQGEKYTRLYSSRIIE